MRPLKSWAAGALLAAGVLVATGCNFGEPTTGGGGTGVEGVSGVLVDPNGVAVSGALVKVYATSALARRAADNAGAGSAATPAPLDTVRTNASGRFNLSGLVNGTYTVVAEFSRHDSVFSILLKGVIVTGNKNLGTDTLRLSGGLTIQVESGGVPASGVGCFLTGTPYFSTIDSMGDCTIENLPPGTFEIAIGNPGAQLGVLGDLQVLSGLLTDGGLRDILGGFEPAPTSPNLLLPADGAVVSATDTLSWSVPSGALTFHLQIAAAGDAEFASPLSNDSGLTQPRRVAGARPAGAYRWRVRAGRNGAHGTWSSARTFTQAAPLPSASYFNKTSSTLALWTFDGVDSANRFPDVSGNGRHLALSAPGAAVLSASPFGKSATFRDGDRATITNMNAVTLADNAYLTYEVRLWLDAYPTSAFWNNSSTVIGQYPGLKLLINDKGQIQAGGQWGDGTNWDWYAPASAPGSVPLGRWVDIAVAAVRDSARLYIYVDGVALPAHNPVANGKVLRASSASEFTFTVGNDGLDSQPFLGKIDEIRVSSGLVLGPGRP